MSLLRFDFFPCKVVACSKSPSSDNHGKVPIQGCSNLTEAIVESNHAIGFVVEKNSASSLAHVTDKYSIPSEQKWLQSFLKMLWRILTCATILKMLLLLLPSSFYSGWEYRESKMFHHRTQPAGMENSEKKNGHFLPTQRVDSSSPQSTQLPTLIGTRLSAFRSAGWRLHYFGSDYARVKRTM